MHGISEELRKFIAGNATTHRNFLGFDDYDNPDDTPVIEAQRLITRNSGVNGLPCTVWTLKDWVVC